MRCLIHSYGIGLTEFAIKTERVMWHLSWHREAKGMEAVAHLMCQGVQLRAGALTEQGAAMVAAAAWLLEAVLEAGVQPAAGAFADAGGFAALRMGIACALLSSQLGLEVLAAFYFCLYESSIFTLASPSDCLHPAHIQSAAPIESAKAPWLIIKQLPHRSRSLWPSRNTKKPPLQV